jgi:hypothetical protein
MGKRTRKHGSKKQKYVDTVPDEIVTNVFMKGKWWHRISPKWVKGYRPAVTYREVHHGR